MLRSLLLILVIAAASAGGAAAQAVPPVPPDTLTPVAEPIPREAPLPRAAFIRALVVPGWGHFPIGEYRRGAVFVALQTSSWAMLYVTLNRLGDARDAERGLNRLAVDSLEVAMAEDEELAERLRTNPVAYEEALLTYPGLTGARSLVTSRERHRQDWIVYTIFFTFASAVDAYVAAHLADFPVEVTSTPSRDGGASLRFSIPVGKVR